MRQLAGDNALCRMWRVWSATEGDLQQIGQIGHFGGHLGLRRSISVTLSDAEGGEDPRAEPPFGAAGGAWRPLSSMAQSRMFWAHVERLPRARSCVSCR
jgi:hypothetical protein